MAKDEVFPFTSMTAFVEGNIAADPKKISGKDASSSCVVVRLPSNYRTSRGEEGAIWLDIKVFGQQADNVYASFKKGDRLTAFGPIEGHEYTDNDDNTVTTLVMNASSVAGSSRWNTVELGDAAEAPKSKRRRDDDDDEDEAPRSRRRGRDDDDDEDEDEAPRTRRRSSRDDDDEDEAPRSRRRGSKSDDEDDEDEDEAPRRSGRRRG